MNKRDIFKSNDPIKFTDNNIRCFKIDKDYNDYDLFEMKEIMLLEKQGIALYGHYDEMYEIIHFINDAIKENFDKSLYKKKLYNDINVEIARYKFDVPKFITKNFKDINNFIITVEVIDVIGQLSVKDFKLTGNGSYHMGKYSDVINRKLNNAKIEIQTYSINQNLISQDFMTSFIHEYNHLEDDRNRLIKGKESLIDISKREFKNIDDKIASRQTVNKLLGWIQYMLWDESEFNAWTTSGYAYLKSINSKREDFSDDIKKCEAYKHYKFIRDNIDLLYSVNDFWIWEEVYEKLKGKELDSFDNNYENIINNIKFKFIRRSEFLLNKFWKKLCKSANLYYNETE